MKDFLLIKSLIGETVQENELTIVDCYVHDGGSPFYPEYGKVRLCFKLLAYKY